MQRYKLLSILLGLLAVAGNAVAEPEMRCRVNGAYIKLYAKNEAEQRAVCERQGGEFTRYVPNAGRGGQDPRSQAMNSIFGQRPRVGIR